MISLIHLKSTFRNRRFILFTIILPVAWFILMATITKSIPFIKPINLYLTASIFGLVGNSIVTFGSQISRTKSYYRLQHKISHYSQIKLLCDLFISQFTTNLLVIISPLVAGMIIGRIDLEPAYFFLILLLSYLGIYLSIFGFYLGQALDRQTISQLSAFLATFVDFLNTRWTLFFTVPTWLSQLQKIFPSYYIPDLLSQEISVKSRLFFLLLYFLTSMLALLPLLFFWLKNEIRTSD